MKSLFSTIFLLVIITAGLRGQSLSGEYFISAGAGEIVLQLQQTGQNQVTGIMTDLQGAQYQLQGVIEGDKASGTITNAQGGAYFNAYREGDQLIFSIIPPDASQQPDYAKAQEFPLTARNSGAAMPGGAFPVTPPAGNGGATSGGGFSGPLAGPAGSAGAAWAGTYNGNINGTPATLNLQQNGNQISGQINAGGYLYNLQGNTSGNESQGQLTDPQTQGVMTYQSVLQGPTLNMTLSANGAQLQIQFSKGAAGQGGFGQSGPPQGGFGQSRNKPGGFGQPGNAGGVNPAQLDQRIVGNWLYSDSYTSGEHSFASQYRLIVNGDGTYLYGDGQVAGGGPGVSGSTGGGAGMTPGKWKTENGIIHIDEGAGWQPFAKYYVEGASMMLTFGDGSKQVWQKTY